LTAMTREELFAEATSVHDNYVEALETGTYEALQAYARSLSERIIPRGVETHEVVGIVLLLRDVLARSLFVIDPHRARQLTEQRLRGIRTNRAKVVVLDITGVPYIDSPVANHLVQTVEAARLLGYKVVLMQEPVAQSA
jgi:hypothetical protein